MTPPALIRNGRESAPTTPQLISLRTIAAESGAVFESHSHPFEEFTLVTDDACTIGYPPGRRETSPNTLLYYHEGEKHGSWSSARQRPRFWVVHFTRSADLHTTLPKLGPSDPSKRAWQLAPEQTETFKWIFLQLLNEHSAHRPQRAFAASAWLQLLLVTVHRWVARSSEPTLAAPTSANAEVLKLWHAINESVGKPHGDLVNLYTARNYDSVRHAFRKTFGCSPREMLQRLRMEHAKNLLLESALSIKEIAARVGYVQQHDFNRLFHRYAGMAPSKWRTNPLARAKE